MQMINEIQYENELILQKLAEPEKHPQHAKPVSKYKEPTMTLISVLNNAEDQATMQGFSQKKKWLLLAEHLEEAHRLGIYNYPVNTICRFLCFIYCGVKPNSIRKALPEKYKDPHQSKIAHQQPKGLTASIYRYHKQRMKARKTEYLYERNPLDISVSSSVTPYKDPPRNSHSFARWLQRSKKKEYNTGIFSKLKKDIALVYCEYPDLEFTLSYIQKVYHISEKELSAVRRAMKKYERLNQ
jgi:hypothetical protein